MTRVSRGKISMSSGFAAIIYRGTGFALASGSELKDLQPVCVICLVLDDANAGRRHKDRYGRTLGYVYLQDGMMLNAELVRRGFAHAYTRFPFRSLVEFRRLEQEARGRGVGLWSSCPG